MLLVLPCYVRTANTFSYLFCVSVKLDTFEIVLRPLENMDLSKEKPRRKQSRS